MKYVLMGTSSNFGNMFSAAAASSLLPFLPMLPSQILLNNLLYDTGQLSIPTDPVDDEQRRAPAHWDIASIRRFMLVFGPISSLFDFLTFAIMFGLFRTGWFVESLATQSLVIFAIRTRRVPFLRSRPSGALLAATLAVVAVGVALPFSPLGPLLGFTPLPVVFFLVLIAFFLVLIALVVVYLVLIEVAKKSFYAAAVRAARAGKRRRGRPHRLARRAGRFSHAGPLPRSPSST